MTDTATPAVGYAVVHIDDLDDKWDHALEPAHSYAEATGMVVEEGFIDIDDGSLEPWVRRPGARLLLRFISHRSCATAAMIVVEPPNAMTGTDLLTAATLLAHNEIELHLIGHGPLRNRSRSIQTVAHELDRGSA